MTKEVPVEIEYKLLIKSADPLTIFDNQAKTIKQGYFDLAYIDVYLMKNLLGHWGITFSHPTGSSAFLKLSEKDAEKAKSMFTVGSNDAFSINENDRPAVRIRKTSIFEGRDEFELTVKTKKSDIERFEFDIPIKDEGLASVLFQFVKLSTIDKTRFLRRDLETGLLWEIDVFHGDNEGLVIAECEVKSIDVKMPKPPESWVYEDISKDKHLMNVSLAFVPYHQISSKIIKPCLFSIS